MKKIDTKKGAIIFNGDVDINELLALRKDGKFDLDKLFDWLANNKNLEFEGYAKSEVTKKIRKRKLDKLKNNGK